MSRGTCMSMASISILSCSHLCPTVVKFRNSSKCLAVNNPAPQWRYSRKVNVVDIPYLLKFGPRSCTKDVRWSKIFMAIDSDNSSAEPNTKKSANPEAVILPDQIASANVKSGVNKSEKSSSASQNSTPKRSSAIVREKLRAARVLTKFKDMKPSKEEFGSNVLDAMRESDKGKKKSGLPEAPTNLFDDSNRGMPKQGLTFDFPGGNDLLVILFSFVFISTVMFGTTYLVWKIGAIHFNEY